MSLITLLTDRTKRRYLIRIFIVGLILFYNSASAMYLYSFLPMMMKDFDVVKSTTDSGKYGAWMASGYFFARFLSSPFWGSFIDKSGRKSGVIIVLAAISTLTLLFGFAQNFWWALSIRLITGFINGLSIIGKVLTTEVCPEDMKAISISIISTLWSLGMTIGPFFGSIFYGWIEGWPYLFSAIVVAAFGYLLMFLAWIYLEETLEEKQMPGPKAIPLQEKATYSELENEDKDIEEGGVVKEANRNSPRKVTATSAFQKQFDSMNRYQQFKYLLDIPNVIKLVLIFSINTFYAAVYGELIPFWSAAEHAHGGLDFSQDDISQLFLYLTGPQLVIQLFLYPYLQKKRGDFWLLSVGHYIHIPLFLLLPYAHYIKPEYTLSIKAYLVFWMFVRNLGSFMNFSALQRYTNDTITPEKRGQINGFQIAFSSLLQTLGPILGGYVLAWSMRSGFSYPLNYHFVFLLMVIITLMVIGVIFRLDFVDRERKRLKGENGLTT